LKTSGDKEHIKLPSPLKVVGRCKLDLLTTVNEWIFQLAIAIEYFEYGRGILNRPSQVRDWGETFVET
jgi:hypothetical protein